MINKLELYLHIPFCRQKCKYCDFLSAPVGPQVQFAYLEKLEEEIRAAGERYKASYEVDTIFFGGGTPSLLPGEVYERLLESIGREFTVGKHPEITIEANPGTLSREKLRAYRRLGMNRLSLGLQSANQEELRRLGRIHSYEEFLESFSLAREAGFDNINIDLMSALPGQTVESWIKTLTRVLSLWPEHISAYSLIIEEHTPFFEQYEKAPESLMLPGEEADRRMYHMTKAMLEAAGLHRYEISNYAKKGRECRHNLGYWQGAEYLGLGLGASSCMGALGEKRWRFSNTKEMEAYLAQDMGRMVKDMALRGEYEESGIFAQIEEFMFLGLRCMEGISVRRFEEAFGREFMALYGKTAARFEAEGLLKRQGDRIFLTEQGIDVSNYVLAEFLLE